MPDARRQQVESIIGRSLLTAETLSAELRRRLVSEITQLRGSLSDSELLRVARGLLADFEPISVQAMTDADLAAWVSGVDSVEKRLPALARDALAPVLAAANVPPAPPGGGLTAFLGGGDDEAVIRFPLIERAAESLLERDIVTRPDFDQLTREARARAFTVAFLDSQDAISTIRDTLVETIEEGASLGRFRAKLKENLAGSRLGPAHIENVFRTNIQTAFHQGHEELASNPIVSEVFPYQEYLPIGDSRTRPEHLALATLGINGTGVYRRDDPFWDLFLPPWSYQCRCGVNLLSVEAAGRKGVVEARRWDRTGQPPADPEHRLEAIPFRPDSEFSAGRVG